MCKRGLPPSQPSPGVRRLSPPRPPDPCSLLLHLAAALVLAALVLTALVLAARVLLHLGHVGDLLAVWRLSQRRPVGPVGPLRRLLLLLLLLLRLLLRLLLLQPQLLQRPRRHC